MRRFQGLISLLLVACIAAAIWFAAQQWKANRYRESVLAGVAPLPDLQRWPAPFQDQLKKMSEEVAQSPQPLKPLGELARLYVANGFGEQAKSALIVLRRWEPDHAPWAYYLGLILQQAADDAGAARQFEDAVRLAPACAPAWLQLANLAMAANRPEAARAAFEKILAIEPTHAQAMLSLAGIAHTQGRNDDALKLLAEMVRLYPRAIEAHELLAEIHEQLGHSSLAATERQLVRISNVTKPSRDPWMDELYLSSYDVFRLSTLGSLLLEDGKVNESIGYLAKAALLAPADNSVTTQLASAYAKAGQLPKAYALLEQAITRSPQEAALYVRFSDLLIDAGQTDQAVALLQRGIAQTPDEPALHSALGRAWFRAGRTADAIPAFRESLRLNPTLTETYFDLGRGLLQAGQRAEGRAALESAVQMRPAYAEAWLLLGQLALEEGNLAVAEDHAEKLLLLAPADETVRKFYATAKLELGRKLINQGRFPDAETVFRAGLTVNSAFGPLHGGLGLIKGKEGNYEEARQEFQRYTELTPADPLAFLLLGRTLEALQRGPEAHATYRLGLEAARRAGDAAQIAQFEKLLAN